MSASVSYNNLLSKDAMEPDDLNSLAGELLELYAEDLQTPFPYNGCRKLVAATMENHEGLIPDMDMYFSTVASFAGGVKKLLKWPLANLLQAKTKLEQSFFEKHPQYKSLEPLINASYMPDLHSDLLLHERMRTSLLRLLSLLLLDKI